jgi:hypothetical protein
MLSDSPAYVFPHAREAIRAWLVHRRGPGLAGLARGPRSHRATIDDALRVGAVLSEMGLQIDPPCDTLHQLVGWALGSIPRRELETIAKRCERHMRAAGVVVPPTRHAPTWRDQWVDADGVVHETIASLPMSAQSEPQSERIDLSDLIPCPR